MPHVMRAWGGRRRGDAESDATSLSAVTLAACIARSSDMRGAPEVFDLLMEAVGDAACAPVVLA